MYMYISAVPPSAAVEEGFGNILRGLHVYSTPGEESKHFDCRV